MSDSVSLETYEVKFLVLENAKFLRYLYIENELLLSVEDLYDNFGVGFGFYPGLLVLIGHGFYLEKRLLVERVDDHLEAMMYEYPKSKEAYKNLIRLTLTLIETLIAKGT